VVLFSLLRRHPIWARVALYGGTLCLGLPMAFCHVQTRTYRQPTQPPRPPYRQLAITSDQLRLRAWLALGSPQRPAVVLVHGLGDSLESYVDIADALRARGHTTLLVDLRGHGGSQGSITTLGAREREDVRAAIDWLRGQASTAPDPIVMGWSMGAVAVLRAAADRDDISAVIAESPYDTYRETIARHAWLLYRVPHWMPLIPMSIACAELRGGFDADEVDAVAAARRIRAPLLLIADGDDQRMPEGVVRHVYDAHPGPKALWVAPGMPHVSARLHPEYWPRVLEFIGRHSNASQTPPP
jgi:uncharacterized protein